LYLANSKEITPKIAKVEYRYPVLSAPTSVAAIFTGTISRAININNSRPLHETSLKNLKI